MNREQKTERFFSLHRKGDPLVLFNAWDAGSARAVAGAGAQAIATGSWSVAAAFGYEDGEKLPLGLALGNLERIARAVDLPVTFDMEGGYGADPERVAATARGAAEAGAVGCNFEDGVVAGEGLYPVHEQCRRIEAIRASIAGLFFINARCDLFLRAPREQHEALVEEALDRTRAYAAAGSDGIFVPGLADEALIERFCAATPLPVNVMRSPAMATIGRLAELGVARVSHAAGPWRVAMKALADAAAEAHGWKES